MCVLWVNFSPSHLCCRCGIETFLLHLWKKREWRGEPGEGVRLYSECGKAIRTPLELSILWSLDTWTNQSRGVFKITKRKALRFFFLIIPVFCGNNQALYILYLLHSWLFGLTNISSHTVPSQPFLENTPPPPPFLFSWKHFHFSAWLQFGLSELLGRWDDVHIVLEGSFCVIGWEGPWAVGIHTWIRIWTL